MPVLAPVAEQPVQAQENGHGSHASLTATLIEETPIDPGAGLSARFVVQDPGAPAEEALLVLAEETLEIPVKQAVDSLVRPLVESVGTAETGAVEPPDTEAAVLTEAQPEEESSVIVPSDISTAEAESPCEPAAISQLEPDSIAPESETIVPEPEPVAAAPAPSSEPELLSQAGSPYEVTAIPELYVAAASWAHQIRELEQALEPEAQSPEQELPTAPSVPSPCEATAAPEVPAAADSWAHQIRESEVAFEPEVISAIEAPDLAASPEVQEPAFEDAAGNSWAHPVREPEHAFEPEALSTTEALDLTASSEVQELAVCDSAADASPVSMAVPEIDAVHETREPEQASEPEVNSAIEAPDLAVSPEVQEPAVCDSAADASPESTAVPEIDAVHETREPEQASEPEVNSAIEAPDLAVSPEVQEPAVCDSAADASPESTAVPDIDAAATWASEPEVLSIIEAPDPPASAEVQELAAQDREDLRPEPESPAASLELHPATAAWASEPEVFPVVEAPDLAASPEVQESAFEDSAVDASPESTTAVPDIDAAAAWASEPEAISVVEPQDLTVSPDVQEPALCDSAANVAPEPAVSELDAAHQIREPEQAFEPEVHSAIQDPLQSPSAVEALSKEEAHSELAPVPSPAAPALLPNDVSAQFEEPEPAAVAGQQLALDLSPDPAPPAQPEPLVPTTSAEGVREDATFAESPVALESPSPLAAQEPPPEPAVDARDARDREATEALLGAIQLQAETLVDTIHAGVEAERAAIGDVLASFRQCCSASLLAAPAEIVTAPAPPVFDWLRRPRQSLQPLPPPPAEHLVRRSAQPQPLTLAGPCLAPELRNLAELQGPGRSRKPRAFPGWVASLMGATLLVLLAVTSLQYLSSQNDAKATTPTGQRTAAAPNTEALDKSVEISGLRLATTWTGKQQVRFLIVNHSAQDLSGVTLQVVVRSSDAGPSSAPILVIHAPLRSLGPYQSQEIKTALDSDIPASALSDWQSLRTDVQVLHGE